MAQIPESEKNANAQPEPRKLPRPKRGAIPTPRTEIEKAEPYIPEKDEAADQPAFRQNVDAKE